MASKTLTPAAQHRLRIDTGRTHLPVCSCTWRGQPTPDKLTAWHQAAIHERTEHPDQLDAKGSSRAIKAYQAERARRGR